MRIYLHCHPCDRRFVSRVMRRGAELPRYLCPTCKGLLIGGDAIPRRQPAVKASQEQEAFLRPYLERFWWLEATLTARARRSDTDGYSMPPPPLRLRSRPGSVDSSGWCLWRHPVTRLPGVNLEVTIGQDPADAISTLLHEVSHACLPSWVAHTAPFWRLFAAAAEEAFNLPKIPAHLYLTGNRHTKHRAITEAIRAIIKPCA